MTLALFKHPRVDAEGLSRKYILRIPSVIVKGDQMGRAVVPRLV